MNLIFVGGLGAYELILLLIPFGIWLYTIIHIITSRYKESSDRVVWLLVVLFLPVIGILLYILFGRRQLLRSKPQQE